MKIQYTKGDATNPRKEGDAESLKIICHICNNQGGWGSGFVVALSKRFGKGKDSPEAKYRKWYKTGGYDHDDAVEGWMTVPFQLGRMQIVPVDVKQLVCNMIAQNEMGGLYEEGVRLACPNVNYSSLYECFLRLKVRIENHYGDNVELHMPRIGCGLGGGTWNNIETILNKVFSDTEVSIFVYDMP